MDDLLYTIKTQHDVAFQNSIDIKVNLKRSELLDYFEKARVAIHTMKDEHFGISIVEMMASNIIVIAHNSAGPKYDTIGGRDNPVGFLAETVDDYSDIVIEAINKYGTLKFREIRREIA